MLCEEDECSGVESEDMIFPPDDRSKLRHLDLSMLRDGCLTFQYGFLKGVQLFLVP